MVKHRGKKYDVSLDPTSNGHCFKCQLFSLTGVEPSRQSVLINGGKLKDEMRLSRLRARPGQVVIMIGSSSTEQTAVAAPVYKSKFVELFALSGTSVG